MNKAGHSTLVSQVMTDAISSYTNMH